ncbi:MAG: hypothetical protein IPF99_23020 [Deltaproteobacteria bacterium]|nr:hypothetical protein [Deltaproteobacteria bacterium]
MSPLPPRLRAALAAATPAIAPVIIALSALSLLVVSLSELGSHFLRSPLARDPAQFQFIAWAISRGSVDYRDLRDMNAPLSHAIHWLFMHLGGLDEGRFRRLELGLLVAAAGVAGWFLPRLARSVALRLVASLGVVAVVVAEYLRTFPWHLSQRDGMALWFVLPATALGAYALDDAPAAWRRRALLSAGALIGLATTLKPFFGLMGVPLMVGALVVLPRDQRLRAALHLLLGGLAGTLPALLFTLLLGSLPDYLHEGFVNGPLFYKGIYDRPLRDILQDPMEPFHWLRAGVASTVLGLALLGLGALPRRDLPLLLAPAVAVAIVLIQHKGFAYHVHLATGVTLLLWVHLLLTAVERTPPRVLPSLAVGLAGASLALWSASLLRSSALLLPECLEYERIADGDLASLPPGPALRIPDYFPRELRLGASWLRAHTPPDSRIYVYGHDVSILLYARRRPATATLGSAGIDLAGLLIPPQRAGLPADRVRGLEAIQRRNIDDELQRLRRDGAAACVLIDRSPWMTEPTALDDLQRHAPALAEHVLTRYVEAANFGPVHIWIPKER